MALTAEQQSSLLKAYQQGIASGLTKEQATASVKDYLVKSGQYDSAKSAYQSQSAPVSQTAQPQPSSPQVASQPSAPVTASVAAPAAVPAPAPAPSPAPSPKPSAPATPKPTAEANGATVAPQRVQQINANLVEGAKNAKQNFTDVNTFKAAYGYDQKPEGEKAILDSFWSKYAEQNAIKPVAAPATPAPALPTKDALISAIWNNQETPEMKASPEYVGLKNAAEKARKFSAMSADELVGAITNSQLTDAQAAVISKLDPSFQQKWTAAKAQYNLQVSSAVTNQSAAELANAALGSDVGEDGITPDKYEDPIISAINKQIEAINSASAVTQAEKDAQAEVNSKKAKIDELTQSRDKIYDDIVASHPGLPKSLTMAMAAEKSKPLNEQIATLTREANLALGVYNAAVEQRQTSGETAKTVASLNLEVAKRYSEVQEERAKALQEKLKTEKLDTKIETVDGRKKLINMQNGKVVADIGPDISDKKYELKEIGGKQYFVDPQGNTMPALGEGEYDWKASAELAKEYSANAQAKNFMETASQYNRMIELKSQAEQGKLAPGVFDIAVIKTMEKMLDPNSVVREGEFNNYLAASGIKENVKSLYERLVLGGKIPDTIRDSLVNAINTAYGAARDSIAPFQESFMKNVEAVNADPVRVFGGYWVSQKNASSASDYLKNNNSEPWASAYSLVK